MSEHGAERPGGGPTGQDPRSFELNREFFGGEAYKKHSAEIDTHALIRTAIGAEVEGGGRMLDVGSGGVFQYDPLKMGEVVALDLFLDEEDQTGLPPNVTAREGDALALTEPEGAYDIVLEAFLYHHLAASDVAGCIANVEAALSEAARVTKPGGRLVIAESCVPRWFFAVERVMFRPVTMLARTSLTGGHPATLQLPLARLTGLVERHFELERCDRIPVGRWITQFGRRWPNALTPARPYLIVARKPAAPA